MKTKNAVLLLSLLALLPAGAIAQEPATPIYRLPPVSVTPDDDQRIYLDSYSRETGFVYPVDIRVPKMNKTYAGNYVDLTFTIDANGHPQYMGVTSGSPETGFVVPIMNAVREWKFSPIMRDGVAVPTKASLHVWYGAAGRDPTMAHPPAYRTAAN